MAVLQPPPYKAPPSSPQWLEWYRILNDRLQGLTVSIGAVDDVTITGAATNDFLVHNGTIWVNETAAQAVESLGLDTGDAVTFASLTLTGNADIEGTLTGPTTIAGTDAEFATGLWTGAVDIEGTLDLGNQLTVTRNSNPSVQVVSTATGSGSGPILTVYRNSASPADGDGIGSLRFNGNTDDGAGGVTTSDFLYGRVDCEILDSTDTEEDSQIAIGVRVNGTNDEILNIGAGVYTSDAVGGALGVGTVNVEELYQDSVRFQPWTYGAQTATTTGTSVTLANDVDFSTATEIEIMLNGVSTSAANQPPLIRIGPSTGVVSSGYLGYVGSSAGTTAITDGLATSRPTGWAATDVLSGVIKLQRWDSAEHLWMASGMVRETGQQNRMVGDITLSGEIADITLTTTGGTDSFDLGEARYRYR